MSWSWSRTLGKVPRQRSTTRTIAPSSSLGRESQQSSLLTSRASRASFRSGQASASHHETFLVHPRAAQPEDQLLSFWPKQSLALQSRRADGSSRIAMHSDRSASAENSRHQQQHGYDQSHASVSMFHPCL